MFSFPTPLNPWFVVIRSGSIAAKFEPLEYYRSPEDNEACWVSSPEKAQLFMSLISAVRVARAEKAEILTLWDKEQLKEYGREVAR